MDLSWFSIPAFDGVMEIMKGELLMIVLAVASLYTALHVIDRILRPEKPSCQAGAKKINQESSPLL